MDVTIMREMERLERRLLFLATVPAGRASVLRCQRALPSNSVPLLLGPRQERHKRRTARGAGNQMARRSENIHMAAFSAFRVELRRAGRCLRHSGESVV
jgi:hypothetical protein